MCYLALSGSFEYLCYGSMAIINILLFQWEDRLYMSESDVYRRQLMTYKDVPRAGRDKQTLGQGIMFSGWC